MKALLASYYAISDSTESGGGQQKDHSRDIDGAGFDAALYSSELLQEESLPRLIAKEESLRGEIKSLDSSMQNLVYENYNKFIDATDTVRDMRSSVAEIEDTLNTLTGAMKKLGKTADTLSTALEPSRTKITQLVGVRGLLEKLEFLYDLPLRLQRAVELGAYSQAVRYYSAAAAVLARHEDVASLKKIAEEARGIMVTLATTVRQRVDAFRRSAEAGARGGSLSAFIEHLRLLRTIGEPADQLRDIFVAAHGSLLQSGLTQYLQGGSWGTDMGVFIAGMNDRFIDPLVTACERYEALFLVEAAQGQSTSDEDGPVAVVLPVARVRSSIASEAAAGSAADGEAAPSVTRQELVSMAREVSTAYFDGVLSTITGWSPSADAASNSGGTRPPTASQGRSTADALQPVLSMLLTDMRSASARLPELRLRGRASECVVSVLRHHSARMFQQSKTVLQKQLGSFIGGYSAAVAHAKRQEQDDLAGSPSGDRSTESTDAPEAAAGADENTSTGDDSPSEPVPQAAAPVDRSTVGWRVHLGARLRDQASACVASAAKDIAGATLAAAPLGAIGCALLPELDMAFRGVLVQEAVASLLWLVSMLESVGDPTHPALSGQRDIQLLRCLPDSVDTGSAGAACAGADSLTTQRLRQQVDVPGLQVSGAQPTELLLVLAQACLVLAKEGVPAVLLALKSAAKQLASPDSASAAAGVDVEAGMPAAADLRMRAAAAAKRLTRRLVVAYGARLSSTVRQSMRTADWRSMPEPREPRLAVLLLLEELTHLRELAAGVVHGQSALAPCLVPDADLSSTAQGGDEGASPSRNAIRLPSGAAARKLASGLAGGVTARGGDAGDGALQMGIDRLFSEGRAPAVAALDMTVPAITACVAGLALDTLLQNVREVTLGTGGFQQLQVDIACLFLVLGATLARQKAFSAAQLEARLREVLVAAEERCTEATTLPSSVVFAVASDGIKKMRLR